MVPVKIAPEPAEFDSKVRKKGVRWLKQQGIAGTSVIRKDNKKILPPYWRETNYQLWRSYSGICAYLAIFFEWSIGASSTDHFVAKSRVASEAYEWKNYRLSCLGANRSKGNFDDVLDPIGLRSHTFIIEFGDGEIKPSQQLAAKDLEAAKRTIQRLKLNGPDLKAMRARHYSDYLTNDVSEKHLRKTSPFVYDEMKRQNLL